MGQRDDFPVRSVGSVQSNISLLRPSCTLSFVVRTRSDQHNVPKTQCALSLSERVVSSASSDSPFESETFVY